ncbi:MAG: flagellar export chaperone FliS [Methylococcaceae bacterium]
MTPVAYRNNANKYAVVHTESLMEDASAHKLIQMLMSGFLMRVNAAKGGIERRDFQEKSQHISRASSIVGGLIDGIDSENGGDIALNLLSLYEYIDSRLFQASAQNSIEILDEVQLLMREIQQAWDAIPEAYR